MSSKTIKRKLGGDFLMITTRRWSAFITILLSVIVNSSLFQLVGNKSHAGEAEMHHPQRMADSPCPRVITEEG